MSRIDLGGGRDLPPRDTTPINDLPHGRSGGGGRGFLDSLKIEKGKDTYESVDTTYRPIDAHPNPYFPDGAGGNTAPLIPQNDPLPSRNYPSIPSHYAQDPAATIPNYIPPPPKVSDYLGEQERITNKRVKRHRDKQRRNADLMDFISDFQFVIYISILFIAFSLPFVNLLLIRWIPWISNPDGNLTFGGIVAKGALFGLVYYIIQRIVDWVVII